MFSFIVIGVVIALISSFAYRSRRNGRRLLRSRRPAGYDPQVGDRVLCSFARSRAVGTVARRTPRCAWLVGVRSVAASPNGKFHFPGEVRRKAHSLRPLPAALARRTS